MAFETSAGAWHRRKSRAVACGVLSGFASWRLFFSDSGLAKSLAATLFLQLCRWLYGVLTVQQVWVILTQLKKYRVG